MSLILEGIDLPKDYEGRIILMLYPDGTVNEICVIDNREIIKIHAYKATQIPPDHGDIIDRSKVFTYSYWDEIELNEIEPLLKREVIPDEQKNTEEAESGSQKAIKETDPQADAEKR